ncbi:hypothetical protein U9M48_037565 [Paspalum notatum var. saurae]|uniref:SWIM-type domain-containing protein n=1 Tax=Paspalum notatum var. saurae TaxID=547442 RepID=A0AAQ3UJE9_PASNO
MKFSDKITFKEAVMKYALKERKVINFVKDEGYRVRAKCDWPGCPWVCLLSTNSRTDSWQIASYTDEHCCPPRRDNKLVTARRIAEKYENMIRGNPQWNLMHMKSTVLEDMFADVSISKLKRAKSIMMEKIMKSTKEEYGKVYDYQNELLRTNPGSTIIVKVNNEGTEEVFAKFYVCLEALKQGFMAGCRKVLGLDGCFFKGCTNGELLCALGRDANNQMYPVAWAVVEKETNESWDWFCDILFRDLQVADGEGWVIISDQQKGILKAIEKWAPRAEHRNCARHVYANWRKKFKKKDFQKKWWRVAKSSCMTLFNHNKALLAQHTVEGARALMNSAPEHYCRAYFKLGSNCDSVDNNMCESFNKWIIDARFQPIISMLEAIRCKVMVRIQHQRELAERWHGKICPNITKKLKFFMNLSANCHAIANGQDAYEVKNWDHRFVVNLVAKTCSCDMRELYGLPCSHAIACILFKTNCLDDYVADCYSIDNFKRTYDHCLQPLQGMSAWQQSDKPKPKAPGYVKMPGRPKKSRRREPGEGSKRRRMSKAGTRVRCSRCKGYGHNISTCDKRNGVSSEPQQNRTNSASHAVRAASSPAANNAMVLVHTSQQSAATGTKRKRGGCTNMDVSQHNSGLDRRGKTNTTSHSLDKANGVTTSAQAKVQTLHGGTATIQLEANVPTSQACSKVNITVTSGSATAHVQAEEPKRKKLTPRRSRKLPALLMNDQFTFE